jgi:hypothetical protein
MRQETSYNQEMRSLLIQTVSSEEEMQVGDIQEMSLKMNLKMRTMPEDPGAELSGKYFC